MADDEKETGGGGEDSTFESLERDFQEVIFHVYTCTTCTQEAAHEFEL